MGRAILQEGRTRAAVQRNVALMNGNPYAYWEQRGISLHLMPWGAVLCRGVPWLASGFPGGLWTDGAAFSRAECLMKLNRFCNERFLCVKCGKFQLAIVQYVKEKYAEIFFFA